MPLVWIRAGPRSLRLALGLSLALHAVVLSLPWTEAPRDAHIEPLVVELRSMIAPVPRRLEPEAPKLEMPVRPRPAANQSVPTPQHVAVPEVRTPSVPPVLEEARVERKEPPAVAPTVPAPVEQSAAPSPSAVAKEAPQAILSPPPRAAVQETPRASATPSPPAAVSEAARVNPPAFAASYLSNPKPPYPMSARRNGEVGTVILKVLVTREGLAGRVELDRSSGSDALDRSALETVKRWRFTPATRGGEPVEASVRVPIEFRLEDR